MPVRTRSGILYLDFRFQGARYKISTGLIDTPENKQLVGDWDATIRREIHLGVFEIAKHFPHSPRALNRKSDYKTFADFALGWLASHKESWAEWTYRKFKSDLENRILPRIGNTQILEITPMRLRQLRGEIQAQGKLDGSRFSNRTVNRIMQPVKAVFNELSGDGLISSNPATRLRKLKEKRIADIDPFSEDEIETLIKAILPHYRAYVEFLFESGFRPMEANGLKWHNVNFVTRVLSVREGRVLGKDKDPKTERAIRDVEITPGMMKALTKQKANSYLAHRYVFVSEKGDPIDVSNFRARVWEPAIKKAGLKYRYPYQARHTFATKHLTQRYNPLWVANQMGTSLEMIYKHYVIYIPQKSWSHWDQEPEFPGQKRTKPDREGIE
jgi:integrase